MTWDRRRVTVEDIHPTDHIVGVGKVKRVEVHGDDVTVTLQPQLMTSAFAPDPQLTLERGMEVWIDHEPWP
jgi:hypothetical protein